MKSMLTKQQKSETEIIAKHEKLIRSLVRPFVGHGVPLEDLLQEARIGLLVAARRWRADGGASLWTYARSNVIGAMFRAVGIELHHWKQRAGQFADEPMDAEDGERAMTATERARFAAWICSAKTPEEVFASKEIVEVMLEALTDRQLEIVSRHCNGDSVRDVAEDVGMSKTVTHDHLQSAIRRLRAAS